jgi:hypothetical protein
MDDNDSWNNDDGSVGFADDNLNTQLKFLLSKLVYAKSQESHPVALLFEDLHWSDKDVLGEFDTVRAEH